jgi:hypothetical protein
MNPTIYSWRASIDGVIVQIAVVRAQVPFVTHLTIHPEIRTETQVKLIGVQNGTDLSRRNDQEALRGNIREHPSGDGNLIAKVIQALG